MKKLTLQPTFEAVQQASRELNLVDEHTINQVLNDLATATLANAAHILAENKKDLARMDNSDPKYDRLLLSETRLADIANDLRNVAKLPSPLQKTLEQKNLPNGLGLTKVSVPLGVVGIIYEARPNVTFDVFALCIKSGNACLLKGGSDANSSNRAIIGIIRNVLKNNGMNENMATLLPADRSATDELLQAVGYVDIIIPRGSQGLIEYVRNHSKVPVIETGAGIVHTYFDASGDVEKGKAIILNAKTRRVSVCNALDCLLLHTTKLTELPTLVIQLAEKQVVLYADPRAYQALSSYYPAELLAEAENEHFGTEFLAYKMAIKTVDTVDEAISHIAKYSSRHSEAIVTESAEVAARFTKAVDAAVVYVNASTAFTDGAQFGMGAEIGISTQKLHARGPMALPELTSYKWIVQGDGHVRS